MTIAEKIRTLRKQAKMTQTDLGDILGVKKNAVSKWECGRVTDIPASKIKRMAELFNVPPSYLIDHEARKPICRQGVELNEEDIKFALFGGDTPVSDEMFEEVKFFAQFVKAKYQAKNPHKKD